MKKLIHITISALLTFSVLFGGYNTLYAAKYDFENGAYDVSQAMLYHDEINEMFNEKILTAKEIIDGGDFSNPNLYPPDCDFGESYEDCSAQCPASNVSTYCVSATAIDMYMRYLALLYKIRDGSYVDAIDSFTLNIFKLAELHQEKVEEEIATADKYMMGTLAVYDEFLLSYAMHIKYEKIIVGLIKYRTKLKGLKRSIGSMMLSIIDVTSTKCQ
ncbi:hypothetical protein KJ632_00665 [Patescibacteria group bacterium]|nr:hypothetical protein [Patescibacteria group bacterium]